MLAIKCNWDATIEATLNSAITFLSKVSVFSHEATLSHNWTHMRERRERELLTEERKFNLPHPSHTLHSSQNHLPPLAINVVSSGPAVVQLRWINDPHSEQALNFSGTPFLFLASVPRHSVQIGRAVGGCKITENNYYFPVYIVCYAIDLPPYLYYSV